MQHTALCPKGFILMNELNLIDPQTFQNLLHSTGNDLEFLNELMETYFQDAPRALAALRTAFVAGQASEFRRAAHNLKSNSANFGAHQLAARCKELEEMGKAGCLEGAESKIAMVEAEYAQVQRALEQKRAELRSTL